MAALVARGLTNRQIADELVITEGTAANHVKHILARLVLDSRVQIATWAIERGLHCPRPPDRLLSTGSYFGEIALLGDDSARRTATVRSMTPVELFSLQEEDFRILYRAQPRIARDVSRLTRARLDQSRQLAGA